MSLPTTSWDSEDLPTGFESGTRATVGGDIRVTIGGDTRVTIGTGGGTDWTDETLPTTSWSAE